MIRSVTAVEILFDRSCDLYLELDEFSKSDGLLGVFFDLVTSIVVTGNLIASREANYYISWGIP